MSRTMTSNACDIQIPATEIQIAEAIRTSGSETADTIRRLAFERDRLQGEAQRLKARLDEIETDEIMVSGEIQEADERVAKAEAEVQRLKAIVEKLPKTADGVPIVPNKIYWIRGRDGIRSIRSDSIDVCQDGSLTVGYEGTYYEPEDLYSTREAAEAAGHER